MRQKSPQTHEDRVCRDGTRGLVTKYKTLPEGRAS